MSESKQPAGRLAGAKAPSYVRAVSEPEARASVFTARWMLVSDVAYVLSAAEVGYTPPASAHKLIAALLELLDSLTELDFRKPAGDIVAQREAWMAERVGREHTAWLHLGRNRGESLRNYLPRMFFRQHLHQEAQVLARLLDNLVRRADPVLEALSPNYHHLQHSGFTTLGEYLLSWAVVFERHFNRIEEADHRLDKAPSPFGGRSQLARLYDRVSKRLGFSQRAQLRRDGIWIHDQFTEPFFVHCLIAVDLARLAQDFRVWMTPEFGFLQLADEHAGGSSALPHAKVPFALQSVIGGAVIASTRLAGEMAAACNPSEGSEPLYQSASLYGLAEDIGAWTGYMADVVDKAHFDLEELSRKAVLDYAGSSEAHDRLVYDYGVPFRTGHRVLGALVRSHFLGERPLDLRAMLREETGREINVDQQEIMDIVLGKRLTPSTFDLPMLHATAATYREKAAAATSRFSGPSVVERAAEQVLTDARRWLSSAAQA
ncbi:MAG: lyase family protein [Xanthobacteraceae bacterium]